MKIAAGISTVLLLLCVKLQAQTEALKVPFRYDASTHLLEITCTFEKMQSSFLVIISDSLHHTYFLDNRAHIRNHYSRQIDLSSYPKGKYYLRVSDDEGIMNKELRVD